MIMKAYVALLVAVICSSALTDKQVPQITTTSSDPLVVLYGRTLVLSPIRHLNIVFPKDYRCEVTVISTHDDPLSQRIGFLKPNKFHCDFAEGEVSYIHLGSKAPSKDFVRLNIQVDSATETFLRRVRLDITVDFKEMEILTTNNDLIVQPPGRISKPIDHEVLHFTYNPKVETCTIIVRVESEKGLPRYGRLVNISRSASQFVELDCDEFLNAGVRYEHTKSAQSPNRDYIPMVVEIRDHNGEKAKEHFQVAVRILDARPNKRPEATFMSSKYMDVAQFVTKLITTDVLDATDEETEADNLILNVTQPLGPNEGSIINTDDPYTPITSFYRKDLSDLKIAYRPPMTMTSKKRIYEVVFEAIDTEATHSDPIRLLITLWPMNTLAPRVTKNKELVLHEGESRIISSKDNLQILDMDNMQDVKIYVVGGLKHGKLHVRGKLSKMFTPRDLDNGTIVYQHDDSDTNSDNIILNATDHKQYVEFVFVIKIIAVDDQHPVLVHNTGLQLDKNRRAIISEYSLRAEDIDSDSNKLEYLVVQQGHVGDQLEKPSLQAGYLMLKQKERPSDPENWIHQPDSFYVKTGIKSFTQEDISNEKLYYVHNGAEIFEDRFYFILVDNALKPNQSPLETFLITINQVDIKFPQLYQECTMYAEMKTADLLMLNREMIYFTDADSDETKLLYTITEAPHLVPQSNETKDAGRVVLSEQPNMVLSNFTQLQLIHGKISYKPPSNFLTFLEEQVVHFKFSVSDSAGHIVDNQIFKIRLHAPNNQVNKRVIKLEYDEAGILHFSSSDKIVENKKQTLHHFLIVSLPVHGILYRNGWKLDLGENFTSEDIMKGRLLYYVLFGKKTDGVRTKQHSGKETTFQIHAASKVQYRNAPTLAKNIGPSLVKVSSLSVEEGGSAAITSEALQATDPDTDDLKLLFMVNSFPKRGDLLVNGKMTNNFTQEDVINGRVIYRHDMGEIGVNEVQDFFNLTLSDDPLGHVLGGTPSIGFTFFVTISPVDNKEPVLEIRRPVVVWEGSKASVTTNNVHITDMDTRPDDVTCWIDASPLSGFLENVAPCEGTQQSREGISIGKFTMQDLFSGHINFVQNNHLGREPRSDRFALSCSDGVKDSIRRVVSVDIVGRNDEAPRLFVTNFNVKEGDSRILNSVLLNVEDRDVPRDNLTIKLVKPPKHGVIVDRPQSPSKPITSFPFYKIKEKTITYNHDGSETTRDVFKLAVFDGLHEVRKDVRVTILPIDDETPRLVTNKGITLTRTGETRMVSSDVLRAEDVDSVDEDLRFTLRRLPARGRLIRYGTSRLSVNLTAGSSFTQRDVNKGRVFFTDHSIIANERREIRFDVSDGKNSLVNQIFYINMNAGDKIYPIVVSKGVSLRKGSSVSITTDMLTSEDRDSPDEKLVYYISKPPSKGFIELTDQPGVPVSRFTQLQLAGSKVKYVHTSSDGSSGDSFDFEVSDGKNSVMKTFRIRLHNGDNAHTVLQYSRLSVSEGQTKTITTFELKADDSDTEPASLRFSITQIPVNGFIIKRGKPTMTFTQDDINNNLISYQHDGSDTTRDSFSFIVTDGTHLDFYVLPNTKILTRTPQVMQIHIKAIDNKIPQLIINRGGTTLDMLPEGSYGLRITNDLLKAVDPDTNDTQLSYKIAVFPDHGIIRNFAMGNRKVSVFQQGDIDKGAIYYALNSTNVVADRFYFDVSDPGMNVLSSQRFSLNWAWIALDLETYTVSEIDRLVVITLTRSGFLGESSFVGITAVDGSATLNDDFVPNSAEQVQFNPGERFRKWIIRVIDDQHYEGLETFTVRLTSPVMSIIGQTREATIRIRDPEDKPVIFLSKLKYFVEENSEYANVMLYRHGDTSKQNQVKCFTLSGTALGTTGSLVQSNKDFISRSKSEDVVFNQGERTRNCSVKLIDDSLFENEEEFAVLIEPSIGTAVSSRHNKSVVVIKKDVRDEPRIHFQSMRHVVDESSNENRVIVKRTGTDLSRPSSVVVRSKRTNPVSAKANKDYIPVSKTLHFPPGAQVQKVDIKILDDRGEPVREGPEYFELALALPINARVIMPDRTLMIINDSYSDLPKIQFKKATYTVNEDQGSVSSVLVRSGDLRKRSAVRCYTRQLSAKAGVDYVERPNTDDDLVWFEPGEKIQECRVVIRDDLFYERDEKLRLVLGEAKLVHGITRSSIGERSQTVITIKDDSDLTDAQTTSQRGSSIGFEKKRHFVNEPRGKGRHSYLTLTVMRTGDLSKTSIVRLFTKDGSAKADLDFAPLSKVLIFGRNVSRVEVKIKLLADGDLEMREAFTVHLTKDRKRVALINNNKVIVYIQENLNRTGVTFPLIPTVVSLRDYDDVSKAPAEPFQGYPLICVTACDPKHPRYAETGSLCARQSIDNSRTRYTWEVAAATGPDGVTIDFRAIDSETFFASTSRITLDSIYFAPGSRVRCMARAMTNENFRGLVSTSDPVTISRKEGLCLPQRLGEMGVESFSTQITYTGSESLRYPNMIKIQVLVPHIDGMLPAISTKSLSNFEITLTADASRRGQHLCSNLLDVNEVRTKSGFLTSSMKDSHIVAGTEPYQYNSKLRGNSTVRFYRNLNLEACMWTFENYYTMSELVRECGGRISTDGQVKDLTRSHLSVTVPLYVSYIYHSAMALGGWVHFDHLTNLRMSFTYDTAVLWRDGIGTPEGSDLKGHLFATSLLIRPQDKRLVVNFRTQARFRGTFITGQDLEDPNLVSMVMSPNQPNLSFRLKLLRSAPTYNSPEQMWQFTSEFAVRDYSGVYYIKLIPCTVTKNIKYSQPLKCNPRQPITFRLPIRFQQTSDPEAVEFNVRTQFFLLSSKDVWLSNRSHEVMEQSDAAFSLGSTIYGRVMVDPRQSLGSAYHVSVEKVFVCSGLDGYTPQYDPKNERYGCLADSDDLIYRFKILDRGAPHKIEEKFRNIPFEAMLAIDDIEAHALVRQPNSDGFRFQSSPLFQVSIGRLWYLHAIYTIRSSHSFTRGIGKRNVDDVKRSHIVHSLSKRAPNERTKEPPGGATLLRSIKLDYSTRGGLSGETEKTEDSPETLKWILVTVVTICVILIVIVIVLVTLYRRKSVPVTTAATVHGDPMQGTEV